MERTNQTETRRQRLVRLATLAGSLYTRDLVAVSPSSGVHLKRYMVLAKAAREEWKREKGIIKN